MAFCPSDGTLSRYTWCMQANARVMDGGGKENRQDEPPLWAPTPQLIHTPDVRSLTPQETELASLRGKNSHALDGADWFGRMVRNRSCAITLQILAVLVGWPLPMGD